MKEKEEEKEERRGYRRKGENIFREEIRRIGRE